MVEFTGIPADALEITLMFNGVSLDGSGSILVELGTSSGYITQGYTATSQTENGDNSVNVTNAFTIYSVSNNLHHGKFDINKFSDTSYTFEGQSRTETTGGVQAYGSLSGVSGTITKLKIRPANTGSGVQFDSGSISISYKTASSGSGGVGITIQEEASPLSTDALILNFEGSGVTATGTGSTKTITIPGGSSEFHLTVFVNSGTFTPPAGTSSHIVWVTGSGGGSGAARGEYDDSSINGFSGSGGGGATVVRRYSSAEMGNSALVTVGSGGNGGNSSSGGTGGTSTFNPGGTGTTLTANGGVGSGFANETTTNGGAGGGGSGGQYGFNGDPGLRGNYGGGSAHFEEGGSSFYGQNTYGSGGDGRRRYGSGTQNGQSGNGGIVVVQSF